MSTKCIIAMQTDEDKYKSIFCKYDGFLSDNGLTLYKHYNTPERVTELVALGDLYLLGEKLYPDADKPHTYDNMQEGVTVAYARDIEHTKAEMSEFTFDEMLNNYEEIEYIYIYGKDNRWTYADLFFGDGEFHDVEESLKEEELLSDNDVIQGQTM